MRPHEAPVFGSNVGAVRGVGNFLPRILSAPSILAVERLHCAQLDTSTAATSGHKRLCMEDNGCDRREAVCAVSDDSGASEMTGDAAALTDGAGSAAAFPLNGCACSGHLICAALGAKTVSYCITIIAWAMLRMPARRYSMRI